MVADAGRGRRMVEVEIPVDHVDPVDHQVGEDAAAKIPEPAPVAEAVLVERLVRARCPGTASNRPSWDRCSDSAAAAAVGVAVPGEMHLVNLAELAGLDDLVRLLRCAACSAAACRPARSGCACSGPRSPRWPSDRSCVSGFSTYTSLPAAQASTVIGTCQWSGVPISTASMSLRSSSSGIVLRRERLRLGQLLAFRQVHVPDVAHRGDLHAGNRAAATPSAAGSGRRCRCSRR